MGKLKDQELQRTEAGEDREENSFERETIWSAAMEMSETRLTQLQDPFPEEDIEWRLSQCGVKGNGQIWATCLAYLNSRAIQERLDTVMGPENWRVSYVVLGGDKFEPGLICNLSLRINGEWVTKQDGSEQTEIEPFKGGISSALKRAACIWGIGRYLYRLETGFAQIVEDKRGAQYGKTKEGKSFYWIPPALPNWALPKNKREKMDHARMNVKPQQPSPGDGHQPQFEDFR